MMLKLLNKFYVPLKYTIFGVLIQCILYSVVPAYHGEAQKVSIENIQISITLENKSIREIFLQIEKLTDFKFAYHRLVIGLDQKLPIKQSSSSLADLLRTISRETDLGFKRVGKLIYVKKKEKRSKVEVLERLVAEKIITGKVTDQNGESLPGASVLIKGTTMGTVTDVDGNYTLRVPDNATTLVFSYVGYLQEEVEIAGRTIINLEMVPDISTLAEVVVVGYGVQDRKTVAGSVDQISSEVFEARPVTNTLNALQGAIPNLTITRTGGQPGREGYDLRLRGFSSVNGGNSPLVIVDGVPGELDLLNPNDLESITVLKDASASIYGARAANGVILVTTKRGKAGAPKITFNAIHSINVPSNLLDQVNTRQFAEMEIEAATNAGITTPWSDFLDEIDNGADPVRVGNTRDYFFFGTTDWNDLVFENGSQQQYNLSVSGGGDNSNYLFSGGYISTDGIVRPAPDKNERYNLRMNYDFHPLDRLTFKTRISFENNVRKETADIHPASRLSGTDRALRTVSGTWSFFPTHTPGGELFSQWGYSNPLGIFAAGDKETSTQIVRTNFMASYQIIDGLTINAQAGITNTSTNIDNITRSVPYYGYEDNFNYFEWGTDPNFAYKSNQKNNYRNYTAYFDYQTTIGVKHSVSVTGGASHEENDFEEFFAQRENFSQEELFELNLGGTENQVTSSGASDWAIRSFFGRATYIFDSKYIAELNFRRDGTSRFSPDQRWGNFFGFSGAWVASEESFIQDLNIFDNLKLRVSYGEAGNQAAGGLYDYQPRINVGNLNYPFGDGTAQAQQAGEADENGDGIADLVSQIRTWEELKTTNVGIDIGVLDARLSATFDYFVRRNDNLLVGVNLPSTLGGAPPAQNIGELEGKGWELSLGWSDRTASGITYGARVVVSDNTNKLINLNGRDAVGIGLNELREGYPINTYFGYQVNGLIQDEATLERYRELEGVPTALLGLGDVEFADLNGDGRLSVVDENGNDADIVDLGTIDPRYTFGVNLNIGWKGFDVSAIIQGVAKRTQFRTGDFALPFRWPWFRPLARFYNQTWSPERTGARFPRLNHSDVRTFNYQPSTLLEENGAYARLKNITVGYTLPSKISQKISIPKVRIYFSGEDLFTIDDLDGGYDPETTNGDVNFYPFTRRYAFGLDITL